MKRLLAVLLLAGLVVVLPRPAFACSCADIGAQGYVDYADVVVAATVTDIDGDPDGRRDRAYDLDVHAVFKGEVGAQAVMQSVGGEGMCGVAGFDRGDRAVFFLNRDGDELTSGLCTGNGFVSVTEIEELLGSPRTPTAPTAPVATDTDTDAQVAWNHPAVLATGGGAMVLAIGGLLLLRRRRA